MKKILSLLLAVAMVFGGVTVFGSAVSDEEPILQFKEDGSFKILQLADIQDGRKLHTLTKKFISDLIDSVQPDLVVLTGDNIAGNKAITKRANKKLIDNFMSIFEEKGVKVAAVFGNHDGENKCTKDEQFEIYKEYSCFIGDETEEQKALSGCGTYNIPIMSSTDAEKKAFNLWFFDSQEYNEANDLGGYGCVEKDQIEWYEKTEAALKAENGGTALPSLAFQHIIIPEIFDVLIKTAEKDALGKIINKTEDYDEEYSVEKDGIIYTLPEEYKGEDVFLSEVPCPPNYSNGQVQSMAENGNVLGIAVGHDHKNCFVIPCEGVDIIQTPTVGFAPYGDENRGARLITLNESDLSDYETEMIFFREFYDMNDEELKNRLILNNQDASFFEKVAAFFRLIFCMIF